MDTTQPGAASLPSTAACGIALVVAALIFAAVAAGVSAGGPLTELDRDLAGWFGRHATPAMTAAMIAITTLNSTVAVAIYAALLGLREAWLRRWRRVTLLVLCVGGGLLLNGIVKLVFHRARPLLESPHLRLETYSFPSGHAAGSTLLYGLLLVGWFGLARQWRRRAAGAIVAMSLVALVAFSRVYLGVHYLSDVVAGCAEAVAWLALCFLALGALWPEPAAGRAGEALTTGPRSP